MLASAVTQNVVLYDVTRSSVIAWQDVLPSVLMIALGLLLWLRRDDKRYRIGSLALLGFGILVGTVSVAVAAIQHRALSRRLATGDYDRVEGAITNFSPGSFDGHTTELFTVAGHTYTFKSTVTRAGYHDVQGSNGPLRDGVVVRIADINGTIARLELIQ